MMTNTTVRVDIKDKFREYPAGITLEQIAKDFAYLYSNPILLARVNGQLSELTKKVRKDSKIEFVTLSEKPGLDAYRRTATLILTKVVADLFGVKTDLIIQFSVHKGYYCEIKDHMPLKEDEFFTAR